MDSINYIIRRVLYLIPVILGVCLILHIIFNYSVTDPALMLLGKHATVEQIAEVREQLGLNRSFWVQYFDMVKSAFTLDFGHSWSTKQKITSMIYEGAGPSLSLTIPAFVISTVVSIIISLIVAYYRGMKIDIITRFGCIALMSISSLAYILFLQWLLAYKMDLFPISGYDYGFPEFVPYIVLPALIWIVLSIGPDVRFFRTVMLDEIYQDYVRTARSKGLNEKKILLKHVLKNAMVPIITYVIIRLPFLILGSLLLESFFSIPGLGKMVLNAVNASDFPVLRAFSILSAMAYILFTLITDVLYTVVDPRVKLK